MRMLGIVLGIVFSAFSFSAVAQFGAPVEKMTLHGFKYQEIAVETKVLSEKCFLFSCKPAEITLRGTLWLPANREQLPPYKLAVFSHGSHAPGNDGTIHYRVNPDNSNLLYDFLRRDYAVLFAWRKGISANDLPRSEVSPEDFEPVSCSADSTASVRSAISDVKAYLKALASRADLDMKKIILIGQSRGGTTSLGVAAESYPGVIGVINVSGGWLSENAIYGDPGPCSRGANEKLFHDFGERITVPVLSVYGSQDRIFSVAHIRTLLSYLEKNNPSASHVIVDGAGHTVFSIRWTAEREKFLKLIDP